MKTPEELAEEFVSGMVETDSSFPETSRMEEWCLSRGFLAGFELAKRQYAEKLKQAYLNGEINSFIRKLTEGGEK